MLRWYGPVGGLGFGFGLIGERRPVPEFIPERALIIGCFIGLALMLLIPMSAGVPIKLF